MMRRVMHRLWRRLAHCRRGEHRYTVECALSVLRYRCVDCCQRGDYLGFVFLHVTNKLYSHWPWEEE